MDGFFAASRTCVTLTNYDFYFFTAPFDTPPPWRRTTPKPHPSIRPLDYSGCGNLIKKAINRWLFCCIQFVREANSFVPIKSGLHIRIISLRDFCFLINRSI
jgi:hypothetical protein